MTDDFMCLYWKRRANSVRRFHTEDWCGTPDTVGTHSSNVALILHSVLGISATRKLLIAALEHDLAEKFVGDVPAPAKWASKRFNSALHKIEENVRVEMDAWGSELLSPYEKNLLKAADTLDCCMTVLDQRMTGNQTMDAVFCRLESYVESSGILNVHEKFLPLFREIQNAYRQISCEQAGFLQRVAKTYFWESFADVDME